MENQPDCAAVIVAAGQGKRMGTKTKKQFLTIGDREILAHTLLRFEDCPGIQELVIVTVQEDIPHVKELIARYGIKKAIAVVPGGSERQYSVFNGIQAVSQKAAYIAVHDGARPFVRSEDILKTLGVAVQSGGAALGVRVKDTLKMADKQGMIAATVDRSRCYAIQTPQVFRRELLLQAFEKAQADGFLGTDECMLAERIGIKVALAEGHYDNIKITTEEDLYMGEAIFKKQREDFL